MTQTIQPPADYRAYILSPHFERIVAHLNAPDTAALACTAKPLLEAAKCQRGVVSATTSAALNIPALVGRERLKTARPDGMTLAMRAAIHGRESILRDLAALGAVEQDAVDAAGVPLGKFAYFGGLSIKHNARGIDITPIEHHVCLDFIAYTRKAVEVRSFIMLRCLQHPKNTNLAHHFALFMTIKAGWGAGALCVLRQAPPEAQHYLHALRPLHRLLKDQRQWERAELIALTEALCQSGALKAAEGRKLPVAMESLPEEVQRILTAGFEAAPEPVGRAGVVAWAQWMAGLLRVG